MKRLSSIVALFLLLSAAAPVLACITAGATTHEESACCHAMHGNCGEMASAGCCRTQVRSDDQPLMASTAPSADVRWTAIDCPLPASIGVPAAAAFAPRLPADHSPPGLLIAKTTVLRI